MPTRNIFDVLADRVRAVEDHLGKPVRAEDGEEGGTSADIVLAMTPAEQDQLGTILAAIEAGEDVSERLQKLNDALRYRLAIEAMNGVESDGASD